MSSTVDNPGAGINWSLSGSTRTSVIKKLLLPPSRSRIVNLPQPHVKRAVLSYSTTTPRGAKDKSETSASSRQPTATKPSLFQRVTSFFTSRQPALSGEEHDAENKVGVKRGKTPTAGSESLGDRKDKGRKQAQEKHAENDVGEERGGENTVGSGSLARHGRRLQRARDLETLGSQRRAERNELEDHRRRLSKRQTPDAQKDYAVRYTADLKREQAEELERREARRKERCELVAQHRHWHLQQTPDAQERLRSVREKLLSSHRYTKLPAPEEVLLKKLADLKSQPGNHKKRTRLRQTLSQYYGIKFSPKDMTPHPSTTAIDASGNTPGQTAKEPGGAIALREVEEEDSAALQQTLDAQEQLESVHQPQRDLSDGSRIGRKHKKKNVLLTKYAIAQTMKGQQIRQLRKRLRRYLRREHVQFAEDGSPLPTTTVLDAGDKIPEKTGKTPGDARTQGEVEESMELSNTGNINTPSADFADSTSDITSLLPKTANSTPPLSDSPNPVAVVRRVPGVRKQESTASEDCGNKTRERVLADSDAKNTTLNPITADLNTESTKDVKDREEDVDIYHDRHFNSMKDAMLTKRPVEATPESERITDAAPPSLARRGGRQALLIQSLQPTELHFEALDIEQPPVPALAHGLDRVLFNRGVYALQDDASKVYNFDPYLQKVMSVADFDFNALKQYKTSSEDEILSKVAREHNRRYLGSTSSMTSSLNHFHFLLSNWRPLNVSMLSAGFDPGNNQISTNFTMIQKAPSAIFLRYKNGVYAVDADKEYDDGNVLMLLGKSLEKLLTMPVSEFERYRKGDLRGVTEEERTAPESYHYSTQGDFLMRSQLDAHDPRLPGTGMFDLKTRAVLSIRMRSKEYQEMVGYQLKAQQGGYESYEREYYDMIRSTLLKYSLQARMGRMDGIFIAYHNVEEIFGFQYLNMAEIDRALHGQEDPCLGDQEFRYSIGLMNRIMNEATARFPEQSMRFHFETRPRPENKPSFMYVFAEPMSETEINTIQSSQKERIAEFEREIMGVDLDEAASLKAKSQAIAAAAAASRPSPSGDDEDASVAATATDKTTQDSGPDTSSKRPLLGFTLTVRSKVNDIYVERPEDLRPKQRWDMEFSLQEISPEKAHAVYAEVKHRRHLEFTKNQQFDDDETPSEDLLPRQRRKREYAAEFTALLRRLSVQGAKERARREKEMEGREKVVVGLPVAARAEPVGVAGAKTGSVVGDDASDVSEEDDSVATDEAEEVVPEPKIENVDEYMGWLYEDTKSRLPPSPLPSESSSEEIESTDDYMRWLYRKS